jgi:hypothetical protein
VKVHNAARFRIVLPLPAFVLHPLTALIIAAVHVYLAGGHLLKLFGGDVTWTNIWKRYDCDLYRLEFHRVNDPAVI